MLTYVKVGSHNKKTGKVSTIYRVLGSCSTTCFHHPDNNGTCYGLHGPGGGAFHIPNKYGRDDMDGVLSLIQLMPEDEVLRVNVVGDYMKEE